MPKVITGRFIDLPNKRVVFVGKLDSGAVGVGFRNEDGETTKISLSAEAATALGELLTNPIAGTHTDDPAFPRDERPAIYAWKVVVKGDEAPEVSDDR